MKAACCTLKKSTNSVYLLYLHYRIINRIITTNKFLNTIQLSDDSMCTFCERDTETIIHLFWQCPVTQAFIQDVMREIHNQYQVSFQYNTHSWFFPQGTELLQTLIITLAKAVIYKARNAGRKPEISHMLNSLRAEAQKEELAGRMNGKMECFEKKWKTLKLVLKK